jgi:hypothetical protein
MALGYGLDDQPVMGIFLFTTVALGPIQPPSQWLPGTLSLGFKRQGREADHSLPSRAEVKNAWRYTSTPNTPLCLGARLKHSDDFTFTFAFQWISFSFY